MKRTTTPLPRKDTKPPKKGRFNLRNRSKPTKDFLSKWAPSQFASDFSQKSSQTSISFANVIDPLPSCVTKVEVIQRKVSVFLLFLKIGSVDTVNERYHADIFLQCEWREPLLDDITTTENVDIKNYWNPSLFIENLASSTSEVTTWEVVHRKTKNEDSAAFIVEKKKVKGTFQEVLDLKYFPFDCQDLNVIVSSDLRCAELCLYECKSEISRTDTNFESHEWELLHHVDVTTRIIPNNWDVSLEGRPAIRFTGHVKRKYSYFVINNMLISVALCLLSFFAFAVQIQYTWQRVQLNFILILTTITYKMAVYNNIPRIPYLTYIDKLLWSNLAVISTNTIWHASLGVVTRDIPQTSYALMRTWLVADTLVGLSLLSLYLLMIALFSVEILLAAGKQRRKIMQDHYKFREMLKEHQVPKFRAIRRISTRRSSSIHNTVVTRAVSLAKEKSSFSDNPSPCFDGLFAKKHPHSKGHSSLSNEESDATPEDTLGTQSVSGVRTQGSPLEV